MAKRKRAETEHCAPVSLPGAPRIRASGPPVTPLHKAEDYGEPLAKTMPSGRPVLVDGQQMIYCQGVGCEHSLPLRESWLATCPRCTALVCLVCRSQGHGTPSGGRCAPVVEARD